MSVDRQIKFRGSLSPIMSAIRIGSDTMRVSIDVPRSDIQDAIGLTALEGLPLNFTVSVDSEPFATKPVKEAKPRKAKQPKGPHSAYWHEMFRTDFDDVMMLQEVLAVESRGEVKEALHEVFGVDSLSNVSPAEYEAWADRNYLAMQVTLSRQASAKVSG